MPLPIRVADRPLPVTPRFTDDLQKAASGTGTIDNTTAQQLVRGWSAQTLDTTQASALKTAVLAQAGSVQDPAARATLQTFLSTLPATDDFNQDIALRTLGAPQLSAGDVSALTAQWSKRTFTPDEAKALDQAALDATPRLDADGRRAMQSFLQNSLPGLTPTGIARSPRSDLLIAAMDDGHIDANDASKLVSTWSQKNLSAADTQSLLRNVLGAKGMIDPGAARTTIQGFFDQKLPTVTKGLTGADVDFNAELEGKKIGDDTISADEVGALTAEWSQLKLTPHQADGLKTAIAQESAQIEPGAAAGAMGRFVDKTLPRLIVNGQHSNSGDVKLAWTPPFANVDGTPLTNLGGYVVQYGKTGGALDQQATVTDPSATGLNLSNLAAGSWTFEVMTTTTAGAESGPSNQVSVTIQ